MLLRILFAELRFLLAGVFLFAASAGYTQNPFISDQYTADPSARVFGDRVYVFPSHDILATEGRGRVGWFCMEDYHVFSSANLTDWKDHGVIVTQNKVPWVRPDSYSMWAPDCIERNGKYYFYFPTAAKDTTAYGRGFTIGVAIADKPEGPYVPQPTPILKVRGIDPNVFIDKDGQAYLFWSGGNIYGARLKENMVELDSDPKILGELPVKGLKEGPYVFERNGIYYLTYPHVENKTERLEYAIGDNPLGPFKVTGVIMDESPTGCWTNHHSILSFHNQWYLFYHHNDYSPKFDKARSIRIDSLFFNPDGTIQKVNPTLRGVGITQADQKIQIDRFSAIGEGASIEFLDTLNRFEGWQTLFAGERSWVKYDKVAFPRQKPAAARMRLRSNGTGTIQIRLNQAEGPLLAEFRYQPGKDWQVSKTALSSFTPGIQNLVVIKLEGDPVDVDWISFN